MNKEEAARAAAREFEGCGEILSATRNPDAYLYRAVLNVAADSREDDRRWVDKATIEAARRRDN